LKPAKKKVSKTLISKSKLGMVIDACNPSHVGGRCRIVLQGQPKPELKTV
jgi:hypothetical protein